MGLGLTFGAPDASSLQPFAYGPEVPLQPAVQLLQNMCGL
jgi:hypothetical protein